jgi:hypothetical protein
MFAANSFVIRHASDADEPALRRLAELSGQAPVHLPALVGEVAGRTAAAVSLIDCRVVSDPAEQTGRLTPMLLLRARVIHALHTSPALRDRVIAALRTA